MSRRTVTFLLIALTILPAQAGVVAADDGSEMQYPEEIQPIDCPAVLDAFGTESLAVSDAVDCDVENGVRSAQRVLWTEIERHQNRGYWFIETGRDYQNSTLPGLPSAGQLLENIGYTYLNRTEAAKQRVLAY